MKYQTYAGKMRVKALKIIDWDKVEDGYELSLINPSNPDLVMKQTFSEEWVKFQCPLHRLTQGYVAMYEDGYYMWLSANMFENAYKAIGDEPETQTLVEDYDLPEEIVKHFKHLTSFEAIKAFNDIYGTTVTIDDSVVVSTQLKRTQADLDDCYSLMWDNDLNALRVRLQEVMYSVNLLASSLNIPLDVDSIVFNLSNLTRCDRTEEDLEKTLQFYKERNVPTEVVTSTAIFNDVPFVFYVVKCKEDTSDLVNKTLYLRGDVLDSHKFVRPKFYG